MPAKKEPPLTDAERAKRMRELARETGAHNDPATLDQALRKIAERKPEHARAAEAKKMTTPVSTRLAASLTKFFLLHPMNARRLARFIWLFSLIMYGLKIIINIMTIMLWADLNTIPPIPHQRFNIVTIIISNIHSILMITLELLAIRLVIEICFQLLPAQSPAADSD